MSWSGLRNVGFALHDYIASTLVMRGRPVPGGSLEAWRVIAAFGIPFVWLLGMYVTVFGYILPKLYSGLPK